MRPWPMTHPNCEAGLHQHVCSPAIALVAAHTSRRRQRRASWRARFSPAGRGLTLLGPKSDPRERDRPNGSARAQSTPPKNDLSSLGCFRERRAASKPRARRGGVVSPYVTLLLVGPPPPP